MRSRDHIPRFSAFDWLLFICRALDFEMDFVCGQCGQRFATLPQLGLHTRVHHGHTVAPCPAGPGGCAPATQAEWPLPMLLPRLRPTTPADIVRRTAADIAFVRQPSGATTAGTQLGGGHWTGASRLCKPSNCILTAPTDFRGPFLTRMVDDV